MNNRKKHGQVYRKNHKAHIDEYNRLNPEFRVRLPLADLYLLGELFGKDVKSGLCKLLHSEAEKRSIPVGFLPTNYDPLG